MGGFNGDWRGEKTPNFFVLGVEFVLVGDGDSDGDGSARVGGDGRGTEWITD